LRPTLPRRRELLALCLVLAPLLVLAAVTWRLNGQEEELEAVRLGEQRALLVAQLGQRMLAMLESHRVRDALVTSASAELAVELILLSAPLTEEGMSLPWELGREAPPISAEVEALLREGEALEFRQAHPDMAAERYAEAAAAAASPERQLDARLRLARALGLAGRPDESEREWRLIAGADPTLLDEEGMPFALYAAEALLAHDPGDDQGALAALESVATAHGVSPAAVVNAPDGGGRPRRLALAPSALVAMRELTRGLADPLPGHVGESGRGPLTARARALAESLEDEIEVAERLRALRRDLGALLALTPTPDDQPRSAPWGSASPSRVASSASPSGSVWQPYGPDPWLVAVTVVPGGRRVDVVESSRLLAALAPDAPGELALAIPVARLTTAPGPDAHLLGPSFPGLFAAVPDEVLPQPGSSGLGATLTWVVLPLVLAVTGIAAFLLLRDVRREVATASLRAQFVASVSHELKTPLTSIRMFAETLLLGRRTTPAASAEYLETIVHESERLSRLIDNVLDFSRIDRNERRYRFERTSLDTVIHDAARAMSYPLTLGRHELRTEVVEPPPVAYADQDALTQALLNLLSNAVKFSGTGGTIDLELDRYGGDAVIRVRDRGRGIAESEHRAIFERFYRTPDTLSDGTPGTGLGLALVDHVVRAHGGTTGVESAPGRGSTFTIRIPEANGDSAEPHPAEEGSRVR